MATIIGVPENKYVATRKGIAINEVKLQENLVEELVRAQAKGRAVVSQSIPVGTTVQRGTAIDIVVAPTRELPIKIIKNAHRSYDERPIGELAEKIARNEPMLKLLGDNPTPETLTGHDRETLMAFAKETGGEIGELDDTELGQLHNTFMGAFVMGGG
jgi:hypothetical protein